ncbi:hypothetical protein DEU56DRAFT_909323 [Suillus clintonianus]|uniref:uncharacterized protein n=1 Tax=Suillus clintonianus TaxID=1904413 RepID=UPI001B85C5B6|nr:uncharacterized protein DEU56DRAFT_909323 [Suillus clintonianus]KAG2147973.1 hypothetical protein DEU56DRAFT_909323 [Suillus clintonianus]
MSEFWCVCRKYCNAERTSIQSQSMWYRHLQEADDDEKENIRLVKFSDAFRASAAPTPSTSAGPSDLKHLNESNDNNDNSVPCKRKRSEDVMEQDTNITSRQGSPAPSLHFNPLEPNFDPLGPEFDPTQPQPDPCPNQQQLPPNNERRCSPLWDLDLDELSNMARIPKLQQDMLFICALREAHLDDGVGLKGEALERLRNPPSYPATVDDPGIDFALSMFLALEHSSEAAYEDIQTAAH